MHGQGHQIFADKAEYKGAYSNGLKMGIGVFKPGPSADWEDVEYVNDIKKQKTKFQTPLSPHSHSAVNQFGFKSLNLDRDSL